MHHTARTHHFADRLIRAIGERQSPCVVGLDPRIDAMPSFARPRGATLRSAIRDFHAAVIEAVAPLVPAVKLQLAFYEQYGIEGMQAFEDTIALAREHDLLVIADAKRNDIASTAEAYANAFLGRVSALGHTRTVFDADALTVSPFLGRDSLEPFVSVCREHGKGIFVLVKTSNKGSADIQDRRTEDGRCLYEALAGITDELGASLVGESGYSSVGAVVGATFAAEAARLRGLMPRAVVLVPGYGAQGGTGADARACFSPDGRGAIVNASRSITYLGGDPGRATFVAQARERAAAMVTDVRAALAS